MAFLGAISGCAPRTESAQPAEADRAAAQIQSELNAAQVNDAATFQRVQVARPVLTCVETSGSGLVAHFGYNNVSQSPIAIPVSFFNRFWPAPLDRGQPTRFDPGNHPDVARIGLARSDTLIWVLGVHFAVATRFSRPCPAGTGGSGNGGAGGGGTGGVGDVGSVGLGGAAGSLDFDGGVPCPNPSVCDDNNPCTIDLAGNIPPGLTTCFCAHAQQADGTACRDACTQNGVCQAGACIAGADTICVPTDQCHAPGSCQPGTNTCTNPLAPLDSPCDSGGGPGSGRCHNGTCGVTFPCGDVGALCTLGYSYCRQVDGIAGAGGTSTSTFNCLTFQSGCTTGDCNCVQGSSVPFCFSCTGTAETGVLQHCGQI